MAFKDQGQAKSFFIEKIRAQAENEGVPLSEAELYMLGWADGEPGFIIDEKLTGAFYRETTDGEFEKKIVKLIRNAYVSARENFPQSKELYGYAYEVLNQGDHYLLVMLDAALSDSLTEVVDEKNSAGDGALLLLTAILIGAWFMISFFWLNSLKTSYGLSIENMELVRLFSLLIIPTVLLPWFFKKESLLTLTQVSLRTALYFILFACSVYILDQRICKNLPIFHPISESDYDLYSILSVAYCMGLVSVLLNKELAGFFKIFNAFKKTAK